MGRAHGPSRARSAIRGDIRSQADGLRKGGRGGIIRICGSWSLTPRPGTQEESRR